MLTNKFVNVAMLNEKWFYTTNGRQKKSKRYHLKKNKKDGDNMVKYPQMIALDFIKSNSMRVVGRPRPDEKCVDRILLKRE